MTTIPTGASRRLFLRHAATIAGLGAGAPLALNLSLIGRAAAQGATDYKALVCVFLTGGNDAFNTVLATDNPSWQAYQAVRGGGNASLALRAPGTPPDPLAPADSPARLGGVLGLQPANAQGRRFALHPALTHLRRLFNQDRRLAIVANVGPLERPTRKADLADPRHPLPPRLQSHNDQRCVWQAMAPEGSSRGWGGRMGDLLAATHGQSHFTAITTGGRPVWAAGDTVQPVAVSSAGALPVAPAAAGSLYGSAAAGDALRRVASGARSANPLEADTARASQASFATHQALRAVLPPASDPRWAGQGSAGGSRSLNYLSPAEGKATANPLAGRLQTVARTMAATQAGGLDLRRQIFFVELDGFDTHDRQAVDHAELLAQLSHGIAFFDATLAALGLQDQVTLFTASEFGRSFTHNGDGTDHGWGGHHFVLGPALGGGDIHGRFPVLGPKNATGNGFDSSDDLLRNGMLLPTLAVEQLAAALGGWMGLGAADLHELLPNLRHF